MLPPDDPDSFISLLLILQHVVWLDFIPINSSYVYQFLPMNSENDLFLILFARLTYVMYTLDSQALWLSS